MGLPDQQKRDREHDQPDSATQKHPMDDSSAISIGSRFYPLAHSRCRFDLGGS